MRSVLTRVLDKGPLSPDWAQSRKAKSGGSSVSSRGGAAGPRGGGGRKRSNGHKRSETRAPTPAEPTDYDYYDDYYAEDYRSDGRLGSWIPNSMVEVSRVVWLGFLWFIFVFGVIFLIGTFFAIWQACCYAQVWPFFQGAGNGLVGVATAVGSILKGAEDRDWPTAMPSKPSLPRGTILYDQKERAELIITGWSQAALSYVCRIGVVALHTWAGKMPVLAARLITPQRMVTMLEPKDLPRKIPPGYILPKVSPLGMDEAALFLLSAEGEEPEASSRLNNGKAAEAQTVTGG